MTWPEFWQSHGNRNFTPVFNSFLDEKITNAALPILVRVLAWILRNSWGRHSNACVTAEGIRAGQVDCARDLALLDQQGQPDRRKVHPAFKYWERRKVIRFEGREIQPVDPETTFANPSPDDDPLSSWGENKAKISLSDFMEQVWKDSQPEKYRAYQDADRHRNKLRTELLSDYKAFTGTSERGATTEEKCPTGERQDVQKGADNASDRGATTGTPSLIQTSKPLNILPSSTAAAAAFSSLVENGTPEQNPPPPIDEGQIIQALGEYETPDRPTVSELIGSCKQRDDSATTEEIIATIRQKGKRWRGPGLAFFLQMVPPCFPLERKVEKAAEDLPSHLLPTSVRRLRQQLSDIEAAMTGAPDDQAFKVEWETLRQRLELEESDYGIQRKSVASQGSAQAQKAGVNR